MKYGLAQIGARKNYVALQALSELGWLDTFCTDLYYGSMLSRALHLGARLTGRRGESDAIASRSTDVPIPHVVDFPMFAVRNRLRVRKASANGDAHRAFIEGGREFATRAADRLSFDRLDGVYSFSSASLELYQRAGDGVRRVLDHETPPALLEAELVQQANERFADWSPGVPGAGLSPVLQEYQARQLEECRLADVVVCPSTFAAELVSQTGVDDSKIRVLPFAMARRFADATSPSSGNSSSKLRVLFLGNDALRKGLPDLVTALESMSAGGTLPVEVRGGGAWHLTDTAMHRCEQVMTILGGVARRSVVEQYAWADVFVLPTASDAMGVVILEAMAAGVPVIATTASGGPDLIRDGVDGYVVPVGAPDQIAEKLDVLATDGDLRITMSKNARKRAAQVADDYAKQLGTILSGAEDAHE